MAAPALSGVREARASLTLPAVIAAAWVLSIVAELTGTAILLHHHTLIENGPPLWIGVPFFLVGWQVMVAAMMLPPSLPTIRLVSGAIGSRTAFLGTFALVWTAFGLFAFGGDFVLHHIVDATPWLAARPWLIEGGVVALAGAYQLSPFKQRALDDCRHPTDLVAIGTTKGRGSAELGLHHGLACLGSSWALMLLMFAEGFANVGWMAALTGVMVYETTGRHGQLVAPLVGLALLGLSSAILLSGMGAT